LIIPNPDGKGSERENINNPMLESLALIRTTNSRGDRTHAVKPLGINGIKDCLQSVNERLPSTLR